MIDSYYGYGMRKRRWRLRIDGQGLLTLLVFAAFLLMYRGVLAGLVRQWLDDENYNHGLLIPPIVLLLVYRRFDRLPRERRASLRAALPLLAAGLALFVAGQAAAELFSIRLSMLLLFWSVVIGLWGSALFSALRFPLLFLAFMIPLPYVLFYRAAFPLQLVSAAASGAFLDWIGVPLVRTGNILHLSQASLDVVTACSGLRSLLALITFGVLAAGLFTMSWRRRIALVLAAIPIAMAANALRIILTAVLVHTTGPAFLEGVLHKSLGLLTFGLGVALLFALGGRWQWRRASE